MDRHARNPPRRSKQISPNANGPRKAGPLACGHRSEHRAHDEPGQTRAAPPDHLCRRSPPEHSGAPACCLPAPRDRRGRATLPGRRRFCRSARPRRRPDCAPGRGGAASRCADATTAAGGKLLLSWLLHEVPLSWSHGRVRGGGVQSSPAVDRYAQVNDYFGDRLRRTPYRPAALRSPLGGQGPRSVDPSAATSPVPAGIPRATARRPVAAPRCRARGRRPDTRGS